MFKLFTKPFIIKSKLAALKGLGNREVIAIFKVAAFSISTLLKVVAASIT